MEQDELTVDPQYVQWFNNGYLLAKNEPDLAAQLAASPNDKSEKFKALIAGKHEYDREVLEWTKSFSRGGKSKDDPEMQMER